MNYKNHHVVDINNPDLTVLNSAGELLAQGKVIIFPTETVYGIGCHAENEEAIDKIYEIKNRSKDKPFSLHFDSLETFYKFADSGIDDRQKTIFDKLIPNPVTLIYFDSIRKKKLGVRFPENKIAQIVLRAAKCPVIATSANLSGEISPTIISEINEELLSKVDLIIDSGRTEKVKESTVIDISENNLKILRQGAFKL